MCTGCIEKVVCKIVRHTSKLCSKQNSGSTTGWLPPKHHQTNCRDCPEPGEHTQALGQPPPAAGVILNPGSKWPVPAPTRAKVWLPLRGARPGMHLLYQHYQHAPRIQATQPGAFPAGARCQAACSRLSASSSTLHDLLLDAGFAALINSFRASAHSGVVSHDLTNCSQSTQPPFPSRLSQSPPRPSVRWL
jgi:hypothetical protein